MSWGVKGRIDSVEKSTEELNAFADVYRKKFCADNTPMFLLGYSFGAKISTFIAA
jgi:hypothetical protein